MKRFIIVTAVVASLFFASIACAADDVKVLVNGKQVISDVPATIVSSRTMLPFRAVLNALGVDDKSIKWNQQSKSIEVNSGSKYIFLAVGGTIALTNDKQITLEVPPYIENGRTFVPVRFISEALGADVQWNADSKTVYITKK